MSKNKKGKHNPHVSFFGNEEVKSPVIAIKQTEHKAKKYRDAGDFYPAHLSHGHTKEYYDKITPENKKDSGNPEPSHKAKMTP